MSNDFELDVIIYNNKITKIYNASLIIFIIVFLAIVIIFTYKYQTFYITKGKIVNNKLELLVDVNDLKYLDKNILYIENKRYSFKIVSIKQELYTDELYNMYKYVYLDIDNLTNVDNFVYEIKIPKEKKILAKYIKDYL